MAPGSGRGSPVQAQSNPMAEIWRQSWGLIPTRQMHRQGGEIAATSTYKWRTGRAWLGLVCFWLLAMAGAGALARLGTDPSHEGGWVTLVMLVFVSLCMVTERGEWATWKKIGFVFLAWLVQALLSVAVVLIIGVALVSQQRSHLIDRTSGFLSSIPIVIYAMRRSSLFVVRVNPRPL